MMVAAQFQCRKSTDGTPRGCIVLRPASGPLLLARFRWASNDREFGWPKDEKEARARGESFELSRPERAKVRQVAREEGWL